MSTLKHLLSVRRLSTRVKAPAVVSAPIRPPLLSATDNDARQREVKRSEGGGKDGAEGVDKEEEEEEDEEEWIASGGITLKGINRSSCSKQRSKEKPRVFEECSISTSTSTST
jgi:hypothetical protein